MENNNHQFPGFPPELSRNFWSYPKILNGYSDILSGSEHKVLYYILRHTWGFDKDYDEISLTQLENGIESFDKGTGLSRPTIIKSIKGLIVKGFIKKAEGKHANCYELVKNFNYPSKESLPVASKKTLHTIDNITIDNKQYSSSLKKRPFFRGNPMRESPKGSGRWYVIENEEWLEFAGLESEIEWK